VRRLVLVAVLLIAAARAATTPSARTALAWTVTVETAVYVVGVLLLVRQVASDSGGRHATDRRAGNEVNAGVPEGGSDRNPGSSPWRLLRSGSAFSLATLGSVTVLQAGVWLLALVAPVEEVAIFSVAVRIAVLVSVPTAIGMRTLAPRIAAASCSDRLAALQEPVRRFAVWSTALTALAVFAFATTGQVLLPVVFGPEYADALIPALVLCAGVLVNAWTGPCSVVLSHAGHQRTVAVSAVVSSLAFAGLAIWWGSAWGGTGVAAAAAVAMSARNLPLARAAHHMLGIRTIAVPAWREK
jgi:O-antigen/teichoic acid export membrane protein